ncbi:MAG: cell division ATPase MinD [Candidatus Aenigmarchaeota archaeon]|nr:cell division ATPase MinD [Candidatus Aenigmarchaeota archaeon]
MTRLIVITSGKGGVGKTTLTSNLAAALTDFGQKVIVMDGNLTTPNLGLHLGMHLPKKTLHDVLKGKHRLRDAIYPHAYGFSVIPASLGLNDLKGVDPTRLPEVTFSLLGRADYVVIDSAAGLGREALSALSASDETIIITNPDLPSVTDALKVIKLAQETNINVLGVVVNRIKGEDYEMTIEQISELLGVPVISEIPEDRNIPVSIGMKQPLVGYSPESPAAIEIKKLAAHLTGRSYEPPKSKGFWQKIVDWVTS